MELEARFTQHFEASLQAKRDTLAQVLPQLSAAAHLLAAQLEAGHKVLSCGNGGSAADAQHFSAELTGRYERERPGMPGIALTTDTSALTAIANDYGYDEVFARQVGALGVAGDLLLAISTSGNSPSVLRAIEVAHQKHLRVIALTGRDGGKISAQLGESDIELRVPHQVTARIQETHSLLLHCLCDGIDEILHGSR